MKRKGKGGERVIEGPCVAKICHHSEVPGGRHFVAEFAKDGKAIVIHHDNGGGDTNIGFSEAVDFAFPSECGKAIACLFKTGGGVLLDTLSGSPWAGKRPLRMVI